MRKYARLPGIAALLATAVFLLLAPSPVSACGPPPPVAPFAIPRNDAKAVSTATTIIIVSQNRPQWVTVTAAGKVVETDGVASMNASPNGKGAYWRVLGTDMLEANTKYVVKAAFAGASQPTELSQFTTGAGYDKPSVAAPEIGSLSLWRVKYPVSEIASGNCVFREYHAFALLTPKGTVVPGVAPDSLIYQLRIAPKTGGLRQDVMFTGDQLFVGKAPKGAHPNPSRWPVALDPTREYCARLWLAAGPGDQARANVFSEPICATVTEMVAQGAAGGIAEPSPTDAGASAETVGADSTPVDIASAAKDVDTANSPEAKGAKPAQPCDAAAAASPPPAPAQSEPDCNADAGRAGSSGWLFVLCAVVPLLLVRRRSALGLVGHAPATSGKKAR